MIDPYLFKAPLERRENRATPSRAEDRARLKELALNHTAQRVAYGNSEAVRAAWAEFTAAVDNLLGDE